MGKIRTKTLGLEDLEKKQAEDAQKRRDAKKVKKGEPIAAEKENGADSAAHALSAAHAQAKDAMSSEAVDTPEKVSKKAQSSGARPARRKGKKYLNARKKANKSKLLPVSDAVELVRSMAYASFDETVELHLKLKETGVKGEVQLPHGVGKAVRVAIGDDALLSDIASGKLDFDILIVAPAFMPKLVPYAKVLGPKGLMPNPKNGTVSDNPQEAAKRFAGGAVRYKSEAKFPLLHQAVGKLSFTDAQLTENVQALLAAVRSKNIVSAYLSATMTPSVRLDHSA